MLETLLALLRSGETCSLQELSKRLQVSENFVSLMLADLERMGYLESINGCADATCPNCSLAATCSSKQALRLWRTRSH